MTLDGRHEQPGIGNAKLPDAFRPKVRGHTTVKLALNAVC